MEPNDYRKHARTAVRIGSAFCHLRRACLNEVVANGDGHDIIAKPQRP
jgi:hypothetical protein